MTRLLLCVVKSCQAGNIPDCDIRTTRTGRCCAPQAWLRPLTQAATCLDSSPECTALVSLMVANLLVPRLVVAPFQVNQRVSARCWSSPQPSPMGSAVSQKINRCYGASNHLICGCTTPLQGCGAGFSRQQPWPRHNWQAARLVLQGDAPQCLESRCLLHTRLERSH